MRWRMLGLLPLVHAGGADIARSATGRLNLESLWLPSALCGNDVEWSEDTTKAGSPRPHARFAAHGETAELTFDLDANGRLRSVVAPRWGNPGGGAFGYFPFGAAVEAESEFDGWTIPSRLRAGWHFGSERFTEGEFFRVSIDAAAFR